MYDLVAGRRRPDLGGDLDRRTPRPGPPTPRPVQHKGQPAQGVKGHMHPDTLLATFQLVQDQGELSQGRDL